MTHVGTCWVESRVVKLQWEDKSGLRHSPTYGFLIQSGDDPRDSFYNEQFYINEREVGVIRTFTPLKFHFR
ncbi:hypothetical protein SO802_023904 [Lithocarpus litseifolius]|uniref:Uncharacterized protein n=1 Tax=Lithocarpus litseifolius TaxID=425828 RepID=A0AAW2C7G2_9ROSI